MTCRVMRLLLTGAAVAASVLVLQPVAGAQADCSSSQVECEAGPEGTVGVGEDGSDGDDSDGDDGNPAFNPDGSVNCALYAEHPTCQSAPPSSDTSGLPACVVGTDGNFTNGPAGVNCAAPTAPCPAFPDPDVQDEIDADPNAAPCGAPAPVVPPYIPPPTLGEMGQEAIDQVAWPVVDPGPRGFSAFGETGDGLVLTGGFEHALVTWGYEDWSTPLIAQASIEVVVVQDGVPYSETFTASLAATPVEVRWDTGPNNNAVNRHNPPTTLTCDGPGNTTLHQDLSRPFQDWRTYSGYGGTDCRFVWWGLNDDVGGATTTITAEIEWDLVLTTNWDGAVTNIGEHLELYSSGGWLIGLPSAVNVNEGSSNSSDE